MIRVVVADDHHLVRQGIRALLEKAGDIEVVGEATDGRQAIDLVQALVPDVLVIDIAMPRLNGVEAVGRIRDLGVKTKTLMLSMYSDETLVRQSLRKGARGYLLKRSISEELLLAVRAVSRGSVFLSPEVSEPLLAGFPNMHEGSEEEGPLARLTSREREVLQLIAEGKTNREIGRNLDISEKTVEKHRGNLMAKLKLQDLAGLIRFAIKHHVIDLDA